MCLKDTPSALGLERPKEDFKVTRIVKNRRGGRQGEAVRRGKAVLAELGLGGLERPGEVVDVSAENAPAGGCEEAVAFREEVFERAGRGGWQDWRYRAVDGVEQHGWMQKVEAATAAVGDGVSLRRARISRSQRAMLHGGEVIWQVEQHPRTEH